MEPHGTMWGNPLTAAENIRLILAASVAVNLDLHRWYQFVGNQNGFSYPTVSGSMHPYWTPGIHFNPLLQGYYSNNLTAPTYNANYQRNISDSQPQASSNSNQEATEDHHSPDVKEYFHCTRCLRNFDNETMLRNHTCQLTWKKLYYPCDICGKSLGSRATLKEHKRMHERRDKWIYELNQGAASATESEISDPTNTKCPYCDKVLSTRSILRSHIDEVHHRGLPMMILAGVQQCLCCHTTFDHIDTLKRHVLIHSNEKPFKCKFCNRTFDRKPKMQLHMSIIHNDDSVVLKHKCALCGKICLNANALWEHTATHGPKTFHCKECPKAFVTERKLKVHVQVAHRCNVTCEICGKRLSTRYRYRDHMETHKGSEVGVNGSEKDSIN